MTNPYIKPLKAFNPKTDLVVDEKYQIPVEDSPADPLVELAPDQTSEPDKRGTEAFSLKTNGAVNAGLNVVEHNGQKYLVAVNNKGVLYRLLVGSGGAKVDKKMQLTRPVEQRPALVDPIVYVASKSGTLQAVHLFPEETEDKKPLLWQRSLGKGILSEVIATGKMLIAASLDGLYAFEAYYDRGKESIGNLLWQLNISGLVCSPALDGGIIYIGSEDKHLYSLEYGGKSISIAWKYKTRGAIRARPYVSRLGNLVVFGSHDGNVYGIDRKTAKLFWPRFIGAAINSNIVSRVEGHREYFYFGADNGVFYCINAKGEIQWEFAANAQIRCEPLLTSTTIYFGADDNQFYALDVKTGEKVFQFSTDGNIEGQPVIIDKVVYFASTDSFIYGLHS